MDLCPDLCDMIMIIEELPKMIVNSPIKMGKPMITFADLFFNLHLRFKIA